MTYQLGTEQVVGTWTNGKTLYRKTITGTLAVSTGANTGEINIGISTSVLDEIVRLDRRVQSGTGRDTVDFDNYYISANDYARVFARNNTLQLRIGAQQSITKYFTFTVYYTKTS